jgi:hypothetical protein
MSRSRNSRPSNLVGPSSITQIFDPYTGAPVYVAGSFPPVDLAAALGDDHDWVDYAYGDANKQLMAQLGALEEFTAALDFEARELKKNILESEPYRQIQDYLASMQPGGANEAAYGADFKIFTEEADKLMEPFRELGLRNRELVAPEIEKAYPRKWMQYLEPDQLRHFLKEVAILQDSTSAGDTSSTGAGKTRVQIFLMVTLRFTNKLVISPKMAVPGWEKEAAQFGVKDLKCIDYNILKSTSSNTSVEGGRELSHGLLTLQTYGPKEYVYRTTPKLDAMIDEGLLLVLDEAHRTKNIKTNNALSVLAITDKINDPHGRGISRISLLSATIFDKVEFVESSLRLLGLTTQKLGSWDLGSKSHDFSGFNELRNMAEIFDSTKTREIIKTYGEPTSVDNAKAIALELLSGPILDTIFDEMDPVVPLDADRKNAFYVSDPADFNFYIEGISELWAAVGFDDKTGNLDKKKKGSRASGFGTEQKEAELKLEMSKVGVVVREVERVLTNDPKAKAIVFVTRDETMKELKRRLAGYNPLVLEGATDKEEREELPDKFQKDPKIRLLLSKLGMGSESMNLDDNVGDSQRWMFILPNWYLTNIHQAAGRILRRSTKSAGHVRIVYLADLNRTTPDGYQVEETEDTALEKKILTAMAKKSSIIQKMSAKQTQNNGIIFPGMYPMQTQTYADEFI